MLSGSINVITGPHLCANGSAALTGACVEVKVKQNTGVSHVQVLVSIYAGFQSLKTSKNNQKMPKECKKKERIKGVS